MLRSAGTSRLFIYLLNYLRICVHGRMRRPLGKHGGHLDSPGGGGCKTGVVMVAPAVVSYKWAVSSE